MRSGANKKFASLVMAAGFLLLLVGSLYSQGPGDSFYVKVEVRGTLNFRDGKGYFVEVPSTAFPKESIEIWLDVSEDKLLVRRLQQMMGKTVVVRGQLDELPSNVTTPVPRRRIYIRRFEIELAQSLYPQSWFAPINDPNKPAWEILPQDARPGEVILSKRNELGLLSNFAPTPFTYRGKRYASLEGFWQMMLYPDGPDDPRSKSIHVEWKYTREQVAQMTAFEAKAAGSLAEENMKKMGIDWVTFEGKRFPYRSPEPGEHYRLIVAATRAKVAQNENVRRVLLATGDLILKPDHYGEPGAPPEWRYYEILMQIRSSLRSR